MEFVTTLPPEYDARTCIAVRDDGRMVATHPEQPALVLELGGRWLDLATGFVHHAQKPST